MSPSARVSRFRFHVTVGYADTIRFSWLFISIVRLTMKALVDLLEFNLHLNRIVIRLVCKGFFNSRSRQQRLGDKKPINLRPIVFRILSMQHRGGGSFIAHGPMNRGPVYQVYGEIFWLKVPIPAKKNGSWQPSP
eukprot:369377-Amphidinium_carterae.2